jgi:hypothetical protein
MRCSASALCSGLVKGITRCRGQRSPMTLDWAATSRILISAGCRRRRATATAVCRNCPTSGWSMTTGAPADSPISINRSIASATQELGCIRPSAGRPCRSIRVFDARDEAPRFRRRAGPSQRWQEVLALAGVIGRKPRKHRRSESVRRVSGTRRSAATNVCDLSDFCDACAPCALGAPSVSQYASDGRGAMATTEGQHR